MESNDFDEIIQYHQQHYPQMLPQDYGKLAYQSEFGPEHLVTDKDRVLFYLQKEWKEIEKKDKNCWTEPIGNGLCRFHLGKVDNIENSSSLLTDLFILTAKEHKGSKEGLISRLEQIKKFKIPEIDSFLEQYKASNYPAIHHSEVYRNEYHPHYRLLRTVYAFYFSTLNTIQNKLMNTHDKPLLISIDGRCGSGKTFFADLIHHVFPCNVFHIDDYYLALSKRQDNWEKIPGGNIDFTRFKNDVISPSINGNIVSYQPFDCRSGKLKNIEQIQPSKLIIIEGSYSQHPSLADNYDYKIFITCAKDVQEKRLRKREGDYYKAFEQRWIPMEENYYNICNVQQKSDLVLDTSEFG